MVCLKLFLRVGTRWAMPFPPVGTLAKALLVPEQTFSGVAEPGILGILGFPPRFISDVTLGPFSPKNTLRGTW